MRQISDGYWEICNSNFDRDVPDAATMRRQARGNCFTLTEYLCKRVRLFHGVLAAGVCLEVLPNRRNYHASAWAIFDRSQTIVRFDLLADQPTEIEAPPQLLGQLAHLDSVTSTDVVYWLSLGTEDHSHADRREVGRKYEWPNSATGQQSVFLAEGAGIVALHAIAAEGGTRHLLPATYRPAVPTLPLSV